MTAAPVCHYEVLGVDRQADLATIKKAYRKLALLYHPDKQPQQNQPPPQVSSDPTRSSSSSTTEVQKFLQVQQAYECLSDPAERRWYDDHREAILRGWSTSSTAAAPGQDASSSGDFLFDVMPYMYAGCYSGFDDQREDGFYSVYRRVFRRVWEGESSSQDDTEEETSSSYLPADFGDSNTPWETVAAFYQAWESFASVLNYAWADLYHVTAEEVPNRRVRRAMDEENKKARRVAKRARNEDIWALVRFVKKRDPRVRRYQEQVAAEKLEKERQEAEQTRLRKQEALLAREQWRIEAEQAQLALEEQDRLAGRIRLADLDEEEEDYDYSRSSGKKKGRKGRKKKSSLAQDEPDIVPDDNDPRHGESDDHGGNAAASPLQDDNFLEENELEGKNLAVTDSVDLPTASEALNGQHDDLEGQHDDEEVDVEEDEDVVVDVWRCECCKKDFKSEGQFENHVKSKKHKEVWKKYEKARHGRAWETMEQDLLFKK